MSLGDDYFVARERGQAACKNCVYYHPFATEGAGHSGTCNYDPPQVVSHEGKLHHVFPSVALDWYCGRFAAKS